MKINTCFLLVKNTTKFLITGILLTAHQVTYKNSDNGKAKMAAYQKTRVEKKPGGVSAEESSHQVRVCIL
ncbi:MAG: hypothetical protein ACI8RD_012681 [Bacillariaceae sp.]|jgi:hypothetical protein